jgi:hypothetical protein
LSSHRFESITSDEDVARFGLKKTRLCLPYTDVIERGSILVYLTEPENIGGFMEAKKQYKEGRGMEQILEYADLSWGRYKIIRKNGEEETLITEGIPTPLHCTGPRIQTFYGRGTEFHDVVSVHSFLESWKGD